MDTRSADSGSRRLPQCRVQEISCNGTPYEMGVAQGARFARELRTALEVIKHLEAVRLAKPRLVPLVAHLRCAEFLAARYLRRAFQTAPLSSADRLKGIAAGAQLPIRKIALCAGLEPVLSNLRRSICAVPPCGCSAVGVTGAASVDSTPMLAHNFDYLPVVQPFYVIRGSNPRDGLRSVELTLMPLPGAISGLNEAGLAVTCNYAYAADSSDVAGPPITMLISEALLFCRTVSELSRFLQRTPRSGGGLLLAADDSGRIAALEISNTLVRECEPVRDRLFRSNRYRHPDVASHEIPADAHYGERAPVILRGERVHESSDRRDAALEQLLHGRERFTAGDLQTLMSDHGPDQHPSAHSICVHGDYWHTTASIQLVPTNRMLRAAFSPTCIASYKSFSLM